MWPVLFQYGNAAATSYAFMAGLAFVIGTLLWAYEASRFNISFEKIINLSLLTIPVSLLGARALFIITQWDDFERGRFRIWALWEGGVVFYGGFIAGGIFLLWKLRRERIHLETAFNSLVPALAIGHGLGRIGCFLNGCCFGGFCELPWAVHYTNALTVAPKNIPLHPVQLYEAAGLFVLGLFLIKNSRFKQPWAPNWLLYLLLYPTLRFILEFFRDDPMRGRWAWFSTSQWISLMLIFLCLFLAFYRAKQHNSANVKLNVKFNAKRNIKHKSKIG